MQDQVLGAPQPSRTCGRRAKRSPVICQEQTEVPPVPRVCLTGRRLGSEARGQPPGLPNTGARAKEAGSSPFRGLKRISGRAYRSGRGCVTPRGPAETKPELDQSTRPRARCASSAARAEMSRSRTAPPPRRETPAAGSAASVMGPLAPAQPAEAPQSSARGRSTPPPVRAFMIIQNQTRRGVCRPGTASRNTPARPPSANRRLRRGHVRREQRRQLACCRRRRPPRAGGGPGGVASSRPQASATVEHRRLRSGNPRSQRHRLQRSLEEQRVELSCRADFLVLMKRTLIHHRVRPAPQRKCRRTVGASPSFSRRIRVRTKPSP